VVVTVLRALSGTLGGVAVEPVRGSNLPDPHQDESQSWHGCSAAWRGISLQPLSQGVVDPVALAPGIIGHPSSAPYGMCPVSLHPGQDKLRRLVWPFVEQEVYPDG
jgi:hypothetical protein